MSITVQRLPLAGSPIVNDYLQNFDRVSAFYETGPPSEIESYRRVLTRIQDSRDPSDWDALADAYDGDDPEIRAQLERVIEGRGVFVATGQQAGLFVSPLFTLYKALTAARLAQQLEEELDVPVMALFSVASEDHDWQEVDHTHLVNVENELVRIGVAGPTDPEGPRPPVERIELGRDIEDALEHLVQATPDTDFKASVLESLRESYRPGRPFAQAFQEALGRLLAGRPVLISRTGHRFVKHRSRGLLWSEWERREEGEKRLRERVRGLEESGYSAQVPMAEGATNLFFDGSLGRDRVMYEGGEAVLRRSGERLSEDELQEVLQSSPERVSPGALLRPVTEAAAFPVVASVGGPGEIAYLAESHAIFDLHGVPAPVVVPRASLRLLESKVGRVLEKYEVEPADLTDGGAIDRLVKEHAPEELKEALDRLKSEVDERLSEISEVAVRFDPGAKSAVGSGKKAVFGGIRDLEKRLEGRVKEKNQVMQQQLEKAAVHLFPNGRPQERELNPYQYLIRYGESLLDEIYENALTPLD
ncbi:MAG: bacillithiol biosynthesis cysteine-adding enzyme BshC [Gemmatimonadetes bacterium]|uniref:Putative cysteine ligase BshC n=1 Tax=Candidatus Kutchimonas denitrificans TaxID=3056748 RepID=A0AAE5CC34_9BACT|nr:bacillithiol biosynthesis cysteine-adding enzyme BshC [Gemmatimonadota bacterium]NIR75273.1 bacillithiol biosynthesis cysteine-adding enzyme BshC [Candidatus Kutchimonas denitrificans]NIS00211.1 bacillithiol biosynthesis cysteine-adding enzyme BshC [Gemmatimonadota bacterium]NIT65803.1 bacillithiol biosynthesis cysteine-adding enzyme BshC [Gemmatimonadota bacterium]NIU53081.1 bacillithiol biosynthesis cysteine-adding enzyme BshC [Gemmatimonadota bacterium]